MGCEYFLDALNHAGDANGFGRSRLRGRRSLDKVYMRCFRLYLLFGHGSQIRRYSEKRQEGFISA